MAESIRVVRHEDLCTTDVAALRALFDREYLDEEGPWNPDAPYGYSPAEVHVMMVDGSTLIAHVGFQRRRISVGAATVTVAGAGGVLVDERHRATGMGARTMAHAQEAMHTDPAISFGYLGCREAVAPFYESTGWTRIRVRERRVSRLDRLTVETSERSPILIHPVHAGLTAWPAGDVDLHGTPW